MQVKAMPIDNHHFNFLIQFEGSYRGDGLNEQQTVLAKEVTRMTLLKSALLEGIHSFIKRARVLQNFYWMKMWWLLC